MISWDGIVSESFGWLKFLVGSLLYIVVTTTIFGVISKLSKYVSYKLGDAKIQWIVLCFLFNFQLLKQEINCKKKLLYLNVPTKWNALFIKLFY